MLKLVGTNASTLLIWVFFNHICSIHFVLAGVSFENESN